MFLGDCSGKEGAFPELDEINAVEQYVQIRLNGYLARRNAAPLGLTPPDGLDVDLNSVCRTEATSDRPSCFGVHRTIGIARRNLL